jgi:hypothetical protein
MLMPCTCEKKCANCPSATPSGIVPSELPETSFENVTITIQSVTPREAYDKLCAALGTIDGVDWTTDTYCIDGGESNSTSELWPLQNETAATSTAG